MRIRSVLFTPALVALLVGCGDPAASSTEASTKGSSGEVGAIVQDGDIGTVLAQVGQVKVGSKEFEQVASRKTPENGESLSIDEKKEILKKLIEEKALYQEARKKGIDQDPKVQKVMINTLLRQDVYASVRNSDFTQEDLQAYFEEHRDEFVVPEKVQIKRIFIKINDKQPAAAAQERAGEVASKLKQDPEQFRDLALKYSEDPYKRRGGDLGFISREGKPGIDAKIIDKAFEMKVGQISEVFEAGGGLNIITVANRRERVERTFEQMRGSVLRKVKNDRYRSLYEEYVGKVQSNYDVNVDNEALAEVSVTPAPAMSMGPGDMGGPRGMPGMNAPSRPGMPGPGGAGAPPSKAGADAHGDGH